jgi:hypothetical protein
VSPSRSNGSLDSASTKEVVYRGVRWRRTPAGRISWFNDGLSRWVAWSPGTDAPPLPPGWATGSGGSGDDEPVRAPAPGSPASAAPVAAPTDAMARRPSMRSPFRLAPLLVIVFIIALAFWQATRPAAHATKADIAAAEALNGQCLARDGGTAKAPAFAPGPVSCTGANASVKVVAVLVPGSSRSASCPQGSLVVQVLEPNLVGEPSECVLAVSR